MAGRKWFVRGVVFSIVGSCLVGILLYQRWTNSAAVREQVIASLRQLFPGASVNVDSAHLRILGGIQVYEIRIARKDDDAKNDILHIPSAIVYHDKERVLHGELSIRKVELFQPRLRLQRLADGKWNFEGLASTSSGPSTQPIPTLVIHNGTAVLEDRTDGTTSSLEIGDIQVTLVNDPLPVVTLEGTANSPTIGKLAVQGAFQRLGGKAQLQARLDNMPLTTKLARKLAAFCPTGFLSNLEIEGAIDVQTTVDFAPDQTPSLSYDLQVKLRKTSIRHPDLPIPLEDVTAQLQVRNQQIRLDDVTARSGRTTFKGRGIGFLPDPVQSFEAELAIDHLHLDEALLARLPDKLRELAKKYSPEGDVGLRVLCARQDGKWTTLQRLGEGTLSTVTLTPERAAGTFYKFPYRVAEVGGTIKVDLASDRATIDLTGQAAGQPVSIRGYWQGDALAADGQIDLEAKRIPVEEKLLAALPPLTQKAVRSFNPTGIIDVKGLVRHKPGEPKIHTEFHIDILEARANWNQFPYPVERITGRLHVTPMGLEVRDLIGHRKEGTIKIHATMTTPDQFETNQLDLALQATKIPIDEEFKGAFKEQPNLQRAWENFSPSGQVDFGLRLDRDSQNKEDIKIDITLAGCSSQPIFFPYRLNQLVGKFRYFKNRIDLSDFQASHGKTKLRLDQGYVDLHRGGYYANFKALTFEDLVPDAAFVDALPGKMKTFVRTMACQDVIQLQTDLVILQGAEPGVSPDIYWDAKMKLTNAAVHPGVTLADVTGEVACVGRYDGRQIVGIQGNLDLKTAHLFGQPFVNLLAKIEVKNASPDILHMNLKANLFDGEVIGQMRFEFNSTLRYEMNLTASRVDLQKFAMLNFGKDAEMSGFAFARLVLTGNGSSFDSLEGHGSLDVPTGKLKTLPILLDLIKFLGLRWPDRTAFEELHAIFNFSGRRVLLRRMELLGNAVSFSGKGEVNVDGTDVAVDFFPSWGRIEDLMPRAARPLTPTITKNLLVIEMRGKITKNADDLKFTKRPMPVLIDPLVNLRDRLMQLPMPALEPIRDFPR